MRWSDFVDRQIRDGLQQLLGPEPDPSLVRLVPARTPISDESGRMSDAQIVAFDDTWHWGPGPEGSSPFQADAPGGPPALSRPFQRSSVVTCSTG